MSKRSEDARSESNDVLRRLRSYIATMAPHHRERMAGRLLIESADEIERLLRGEFSEAEFQGLCHNFSEDGAERFRKGCKAYQVKLFGAEKSEICDECGEVAVNSACDVLGNRHHFCRRHWDEHVAWFCRKWPTVLTTNAKRVSK